MARERYCKVCRGWHNVEEPWPHNCRLPDERQRSDLAGPSVISDTMEAVQGMHDGNMYTSKSALRRSYKEHGVVEVGNDTQMQNNWKPKKVTHEEVRPAVEKALSKVGLGENPTITGIK